MSSTETKFLASLLSTEFLWSFWNISTLFRDSELNPKLGRSDEKDGYIVNLESLSSCLKVNWNA